MNNMIGGMPFLNSNYKLISTVQFPVHNPSMDSTVTTLYIFDVADDKAAELYDSFDDYILKSKVKDDLDIWEDNNPVPGRPFHRFRVEMPDPNILFLYDMMAYNV